MKAALLLCVVCGLSLLVLSSACGGAAESDVTSPSEASSGGDAAAGAETSSGSSGNGSSGNGATSSGGTDGATPPGDNAFTGAPGYTPTTGRNTSKPGEHPGNGNPSKLACFECHGGSGPGPRFFAAGSVFKDVAGTMPASQIEVRLRDDTGKAVSTYSDALGNFVVTTQTASKAGVTFPLHSGARNGIAVKTMTDTAPNGDCNNATCHGGTQGWIHVP